MARKLPELMGTREAAKELGVDTTNIDKVSGLPPHDQHLACGRIWRADVIREFAEKRRKTKRKAVEAADRAAATVRAAA